MDSKRFAIGNAALAGSVALLLLAGCGSDDNKGSEETAQTGGELRCVGGNECKGQSECKGGPAGSSCEGLNECKGQGWSWVDTEAECTTAGGTIQEESAS